MADGWAICLVQILTLYLFSLNSFLSTYSDDVFHYINLGPHFRLLIQLVVKFRPHNRRDLNLWNIQGYLRTICTLSRSLHKCHVLHAKHFFGYWGYGNGQVHPGPSRLREGFCLLLWVTWEITGGFGVEEKNHSACLKGNKLYVGMRGNRWGGQWD